MRQNRDRYRSINDLLAVMARLRSPKGCPWDREQTHRTLRYHAVEEVYELIDAIESGDDHELAEELGDLLLQVVFHCQLASERGAFDFSSVARRITEKLIRRHPHVFGDAKVKTVDAVWTQWEQIKRAEKQGTKRHRPSALDGIPRHLPALLRAEKLVKKARQARLLAETEKEGPLRGRAELGRKLFDLVQEAQGRGWSAEEALRTEARKRERAIRERERAP
jgi:XTP/dITP diphosphohydrolase